jgi:hypothetical protein
MASLRHGFEEAGDVQERRLRSPKQWICELLLKESTTEMGAYGNEGA